MWKVVLGATLTIVGLACGGCVSGQTGTVSAADPVSEQALEVASPESGPPPVIEETDPGVSSPRRAAPRRSVASRLTQTPPPAASPPQAQVGHEVTGAEKPDVGPSEALSMEEQRRRKQLEEDRNTSKLDQSAARALRSICNGC
jgi:hypothetical protein